MNGKGSAASLHFHNGFAEALPASAAGYAFFEWHLFDRYDRLPTTD
jgi:hypothetical protein